MDSIGILDWFTKVRTEIGYGDECNTKISMLQKEIVPAFGSKNLSVTGERISRIIEQNAFLHSVCSDTRLPVCSLYHHLRNTAAIAVCLLLDKISGDEQYTEKALNEYGLSSHQIQQYSRNDLISLVRIASLLHDIGKVRTYSEDKKFCKFHEHAPLTEQIILELLNEADPSFVARYGLEKVLPLLARRHHAKEATTRLENLIHLGDMISSAADRRYEVSAEVRDGRMHLTSEDAVFPHEVNCNDGDYACLETPHTVLLGYHQEASKPVKEKNPAEKYRILFRDSVVEGGPGHYTGNWSPPAGRIGYFSLDIMQIQGFIGEAEKLPMLRGGSGIVTGILMNIREVIAELVCDEAVLFAEGGNLLAFIPTDPVLQENLKEKTNQIISELGIN